MQTIMKSILRCFIFLNISKHAASLRSPVKSFSAINRYKTIRCASNINIKSKIAKIEAEFKLYVTSSGVDFNCLTNEEKRVWRKDFEEFKIRSPSFVQQGRL